MAFIVTDAHSRIFDAIQMRTRNAVIEAVAGAGKTTTIVKALELVPSSEKVLFLAFNRNIAQELARRVPRHVEARTLNSLGHRAWGYHLYDTQVVRHSGQVKVEGDKLWHILNDLEDNGELPAAQRKRLGAAAVKLARLGKSVGVIVDGAPREGLLPDTPDTWVGMISHFDVDVPEGVEDGDVVDLARRLLAVSTKMLTTIDYDDQLYMPFVYNVKMRPFDRVFVDESQDLSPLQHNLLARALKRTGQLVAVGDPKQAIYAWRGADGKSMQTLTEAFKCEILPLHVSYRCPREVVAVAQRVVPHILPHPDAPAGTVDERVRLGETVDFKGGDMVVCRTNAPAVSLAFQLIRRRIPVEVLGRDIGAGLKALIKKLDQETIPALLDALAKWEDKERAKELKRKVPSEMKLQRLADQAETLQVLGDGCDTVRELESLIDRLFSGQRDVNKVTICTVHKSKGLEAERVFILEQHKMPHPMSTQAWQVEQEMNLIYVAVTRAKSELRFITIDPARVTHDDSPTPRHWTGLTPAAPAAA